MVKEIKEIYLFKPEMSGAYSHVGIKFTDGSEDKLFLPKPIYYKPNNDYDPKEPLLVETFAQVKVNQKKKRGFVKNDKYSVIVDFVGKLNDLCGWED